MSIALIIAGSIVCLLVIGFLYLIICPPSGPQYDPGCSCWRCGACGGILPDSSIPEHYKGRKPATAAPSPGSEDTVANLGN